MEAHCTKMHEGAKLKELESVAVAWLTIVEENDTIQLESDVEGDIDHNEKNDEQMFEDEEWNGIQDDIWSQIRMMKILRTIVLRGGKLKVTTEKRRKRRMRS